MLFGPGVRRERRLYRGGAEDAEDAEKSDESSAISASFYEGLSVKADL